MSEAEGGARPAPSWVWIGIAAALLFNLIPIIGVIAWDWSVFALIFLYWTENVLVGVRTFLSMLAAGVAQGALIGGLVIGGFFLVHYGIFCSVHGMFVITLFGPSAEAEPSVGLSDIGAAFAGSDNLAAGFVSIALWQGVLLILFLARGEAARSQLGALMSAPYPRMLALHLAIVLSGFLLMAMDQPMAGLVMLALMKTGFDIAQALGKSPFAALPRGAGQPDP